MELVLTAFVSLDGVAQAPGGPDEDTDGGFRHGGWSAPYFDVEAMGAFIGSGMQTTTALLFGRKTWQGMAAAWPERAGDPYAHALIGAGLVDRYELMVEPVVLGGGKRVFPDDGVARPLELVSATTASTGVQICTYRPAS